ATSFVVLCLASWGTLRDGLPRVPVLVVGALLVIVGTVIKLWAAATLGAGPYYWRNFFVADDWKGPSTAGPYRYLRNPMYTVGYLQTYGFALVTRSWPGLAAALIDHVAILLFYQLVEKPHFEKVARGAARPEPEAAPVWTSALFQCTIGRPPQPFLRRLGMRATLGTILLAVCALPAARPAQAN